MAQIHRPLLSLTDPYYVQIGAVIHKWATLEYQLQAIIWKALGTGNKAGRVLTVGMNTQTLMGIIRNLPRKWITEKGLAKELKSLCDDVKENAPFRNYLAHGIWTTDDSDEPITPWLNYMKEGEHRILPGAEPVEPEDIWAFAKIVDSLNIRASAALDKIHDQQKS